MDNVIEYISYIFMFASLYFEVFLLMAFLEKKSENTEDADFTPPVTVIVPCFNEENTVCGTIESILSLDYPKENLNLIIVDDGSTDRTLKSIEKYRDNPSIQIFSKENGGKFVALNFAIKKAKTEFIGCLDADSFVEPEALKYIMKRFTRLEVMAVTPSMIIHKPNNVLRKMQRAEYHYGNFIRRSLSIIGAIHITPGPFSFFRISVFEKIGYYKHAHNTEDMEMAMRMQKNHMVIENEPNAIVHTVGPENIKKLYKQRERWVSGFLGNLMDYREMLFNKTHGDLGMIVLPFAGMGVFMTMVFVMIMIFRSIKYFLKEIVKINITGLPSFKFGAFDWFFLNTSTMSILGLFIMLLSIFIVIFGQRITTGKWKVSIDTLYFVFLYSFIAPFWISKAVYNNVRSKESDWR